MSHAQILHPVDRFRSTLERIDDAPGRHWTTRAARLADDSDGGGEVAATFRLGADSDLLYGGEDHALAGEEPVMYASA
jgi:hypothetical protein